ncbi:ABC transporter permease [Chloroflexota bacterium]
MQGLSLSFASTLASGGIRLASVLGLASLGETLSQRSGVLNIGLEGYMTIGTITAFATSFATGNPWLGLLAAIAAGATLSLVHAFLSISLGVQQMVSGIGIIFFAQGIVSLMDARVFELLPVFPVVAMFEPIPLPLLSQIPNVGPVLFNHPPITFILFGLVPLFWFILYRTKIGLQIRATGEFASGSDTMGINVYRIRYISTLLSGAMGGLAGGYLSLGVAQSFQSGMVAGRGYIALATIVLGNWNPARVFGACVLFGMIDALQYRMQILAMGGIPHEVWLMLPYIVTVGALMVTRGVRVPRELTIPYLREKTE